MPQFACLQWFVLRVHGRSRGVKAGRLFEAKQTLCFLSIADHLHEIIEVGIRQWERHLFHRVVPLDASLQSRRFLRARPETREWSWGGG